MSDDLRDLLDDAVSDIEPADRLDRIRSRVARPARRPWRYAVGGAVLATAATVAVVVVVTGGSPDASPGPVDTPAATETPSTVVDPTPPAEPAGETRAVPVYFVGDTPSGPRLFREFRRVPVNDPADAAATMVGTGDALDPDYRTLWPAGWGEWHVSFDGFGDHAEFGIELPDESWTTRPAGMTEAEAELAVQQLVRTLRGGGSPQASVGFYLASGKRVPILGVDTTGGVTATPGLDQLALVSISDPTEGRVVDGTFSARGVASAFEGNVVLSLEQDGETVWEEPVTADGAYGDRLWPWQVEDIDVSGLAPGTYTFVATVQSPTEEDRQPEPWTDTRTVVIE